MLLEQERHLIVKYGRKLVEQGLTRGTGGNLSIYDPDQELVAITPSGIDYFQLTPQQVTVTDLAGQPVEDGLAPSSEHRLHTVIYQQRDDLRALVHTHSPYCATLAVLHEPLPPVHYLVAFAGLDVPCAKYATYGTQELAENALAAIHDRQAVLLANHGLLAGGPDLPTAFNVAEEIEFCAGIYYRARAIGDPQPLPVDEMQRLVVKFQDYGPREVKPGLANE